MKIRDAFLNDPCTIVTLRFERELTHGKKPGSGIKKERERKRRIDTLSVLLSRKPSSFTRFDTTTTTKGPLSLVI